MSEILPSRNSVENEKKLDFIKDALSGIYSVLVERGERSDVRLSRDQRMVFHDMRLGKEISEERRKLVEGRTFEEFDAYENSIYRINAFTVVTSAISVLVRAGAFGNRDAILAKEFLAKNKELIELGKQRLVEKKVLPKDIQKLREFSEETMKESLRLFPQDEKEQFIADLEAKQYDNEEKIGKQKELLVKLKEI